MNFLPGWFPGGAAGIVAGGGGLTTITQALSSTSTASTITQPAGIQAGDVIVFLDMARSISPPAAVIPPGYTQILSFTLATVARMVAAYKIAAGTEGSVAITGMNGTANDKVIVVFRGNIPITGVSLSTPATQGTTADPTPQNVSAASGVAPLVAIGCYGASAAVSPRTFTVGGSAAKDGEINSSVNLYQAWKIYNSSPQNIVVDMDDEGSNLLSSFYANLS